jgi:hypothetical protein
MDIIVIVLDGSVKNGVSLPIREADDSGRRQPRQKNVSSKLLHETTGSVQRARVLTIASIAIVPRPPGLAVSMLGSQYDVALRNGSGID